MPMLPCRCGCLGGRTLVAESGYLRTDWDVRTAAQLLLLREKSKVSFKAAATALTETNSLQQPGTQAECSHDLCIDPFWQFELQGHKFRVSWCGRPQNPLACQGIAGFAIAG